MVSLPSGRQLLSLQELSENVEEGRRDGNNDILYLLRIMLAQALNQQDRNLVAQLHETIRCVSLFDEVPT
jgi:hypothetical protein